MEDEAIEDYLTRLHQPLLSLGLKGLSQAQKEKFYLQLSKFPPSLLHEQRQLVQQRKKNARLLDVIPIESCDYQESKQLVDCGMRIRENTGCLLLAGGQASRMGGVVKGAFKLQNKKTLFQIFCERVRAASCQAEKELPLSIMLSPLNDKETLSHLEREKWYDLSEKQRFVFCQKTLPLLDEEGNWFLSSPGVLAEGPDGNGKALFYFYHSGLWARWRALGIKYVNVIAVDNPLVDPFDPLLPGVLSLSEADIAIRTTDRIHKEEKAGVLGKKEGKLCVVEYSELEDLEQPWKYIHTGVMCFSMDFIRRMSTSENAIYPYHVAHKETECFSPHSMVKERKKVWKLETFLFDVFCYSSSVKLLWSPREKFFAPLKDLQGVQEVTKALDLAEKGGAKINFR